MSGPTAGQWPWPHHCNTHAAYIVFIVVFLRFVDRTPEVPQIRRPRAVWKACRERTISTPTTKAGLKLSVLSNYAVSLELGF
eukprot:4013739-Lingulodinium_polyedra.AAC.1